MKSIPVQNPLHHSFHRKNFVDFLSFHRRRNDPQDEWTSVHLPLSLLIFIHNIMIMNGELRAHFSGQKTKREQKKKKKKKLL